MTPFEAYQLYLALKHHFDRPTYDFIKYNGKVKASHATFEKRRDRHFFDKLSRNPDAQRLVIANLLEDVAYINDMLSSDGQARLREYNRKHSALTYYYKEQLELCLRDSTIDKLLRFNDHNQYPPLLAGYLSKQIDITTIIILDSCIHFLDDWNKKLTNDLLWPELHQKFTKYARLFSFDKEKFRQITVDFVLNRGDN